MRRQTAARLAGLALVASGFGAAWALGGLGSAPVRAEAVRACRGEVVQSISAVSASVEPRLEVLVAGQGPVLVSELRGRLGQRVKRGAVVAVLADPVLEAQLAQAGVEVARAERRLERARDLGEQALVPRSDLEAAEFDHAAAVARLRTLEATLQELTLRAPVDGVVTAEHVKPGERLGSNADELQRDRRFPVLTISTLDDLVVKALIDEKDVLDVRPGQAAQIELEALPGQTFGGVVASVGSSPTARSSGTTYEAVVEFRERPASRLVAGVGATLRLTVARSSDAVRVPREAVVHCDGRRCVFVFDGQRGRLRQVEIGILEAAHAEVRSGLAEGERVLVGFPAGLRDGARVTAPWTGSRRMENPS